FASLTSNTRSGRLPFSNFTDGLVGSRFFRARLTIGRLHGLVEGRQPPKHPDDGCSLFRSLSSPGRSFWTCAHRRCLRICSTCAVPTIGINESVRVIVGVAVAIEASASFRIGADRIIRQEPPNRLVVIELLHVHQSRPLYAVMA